MRVNYMYITRASSIAKRFFFYNLFKCTLKVLILIANLNLTFIKYYKISTIILYRTIILNFLLHEWGFLFIRNLII